jgi:hypothetical protein
VAQLFNKDDLEILVGHVAVPLREDCQRVASGVPRLVPSLPGDMCQADLEPQGSEQDDRFALGELDSRLQDEDELQREYEAYERRLVGPEPGTELPRLVPSLPGDMCQADLEPQGSEQDDRFALGELDSRLQDEDELQREYEAYERRLVGPEPGTERAGNARGAPGVHPELRDQSMVERLRRTRSDDLHVQGQAAEAKRVKHSDAKGSTQ